MTVTTNTVKVATIYAFIINLIGLDTSKYRIVFTTLHQKFQDKSSKRLQCEKKSYRNVLFCFVFQREE